MTNTTPNRRKGPDLLLKLLTGANVAAAAALFGAFCLTGMAKPEVETFFDRFYNLNLNRRPNWDSTLLSYIGILLLISGLISLFKGPAAFTAFSAIDDGGNSIHLYRQ